MPTEFNTRIQLKHDTWANWDLNKDVVLLEGEIAIVTLPEEQDLSPDAGQKQSAVLIKVGDGTTTFENLPWLSAQAADVYNWAKKSEADFITWLNTTANFAVDGDITALRNEAYTSASQSGKTLTLTKGDGKTTFSFDASQPAAGGALGLVKSGGDVTISNGVITVNDDSHNHTIANVDGLNDKLTAIDDKFTTLNGDYSTEGSIKSIATDAIAHALTGADEDYDTLIEISDWIAGHPNDVAAINSNINALVNALGSDYAAISEGVVTAKTPTVTTAIDNLDSKVTSVDNAIKGLTYTGPSTSNATATAFVTTVSQANGQISASKANLPTASTTTAGIVKLNDTLASDSQTEALTAKQGKALDAKITSVNSRIDGLDASNPTASGTSTTFIKSISQTNGKITATAANLPTASTSVSGIVKLNNTLTSSSTTEALTAAQGKTLDDKITAVNNSITDLTLDQIGANSEANYVIFNCGSASELVD